jgi:hypothetical protein
MNLNFQNFPHDFNPLDNFFRSQVIESGISKSLDKDIDFFGCYPEKSLVEKSFLFAQSKFSDLGMTSWLNFQNGLPKNFDEKKLNFWVTFENRRPPSTEGVYSFSFDLDSYDDSNFYLPLIYLYLDLETTIPFTPRHKVTQKLAMNPRELPAQIRSKKSNEACAFISNPHQMRLRAIEKFREFRKIDVFGRFAGNYVQNKIETGESYWLNFCFENDIYPGYVTEKALEAWLSYSIPVYWGDDQNKVLNPKAIVNLKDFDSISDFVTYLDYLLNNQPVMEEMISEPILNKQLNLKEVQLFITNAARNQ